jgi:hypothetical protein
VLIVPASPTHRKPQPAARRGRLAQTSWLQLGREDSNLRSRDQNPLPYRLATPHSRPSLERGYRLERSPNSSITMTAITTAATITIANTVTVMKSGMTATMACENARMKAAFLIAGLVSCVR